jgi:hypothetical protein
MFLPERFFALAHPILSFCAAFHFCNTQVFALINALILTIPFAMLVAGGNAQWDSLKLNTANCTIWPDTSSLIPGRETTGFDPVSYYEV